VGIDDKSFWSGKNIDDVLYESNIAQDALYTILVSHQPYKLSLLENYPIDLQLAGHTHRGQFIPLSWIIDCSMIMRMEDMMKMGKLLLFLNELVLGELLLG
jgi:hypothetical protein